MTLPLSLHAEGFGVASLPSSNKENIMQSVLEILLVTNKSGKAKKTGNDYSIDEAHCVLRNDDGTAGAVGILVIPKALEAVAKPGMFTGAFALQAASYGEQQGRIVATLVGLTPVPPSFKVRATVVPS
jgi:hypothetical protein